MEDYVARFEKLGFGMMVHFGIYSILGRGEWCSKFSEKTEKEKYKLLLSKFVVSKNWAKDLVKTAKDSGCKYITLTTRHHDGFSLYDTLGLSDFDVMHSKCGRDLIKEFVDECNKQGIMPVFYHTLLDWHSREYDNDFPSYIDFLEKSLKLLATNYGKIGGFWFDGMWDKPTADWQENRLYKMLKDLQPEAMIINNTGLSSMGELGNDLLDGVTFERGKPHALPTTKHIAGEMCQILNDHWGYAEDDCNYKSVKSLIEDLVDSRKYNCNFLLNVGLTGQGRIKEIDRCIFREIGKWIKINKDFIYSAKSCDLTAENADILYDGKYYYAVIKNVPMSADPNVSLKQDTKSVKINTEQKVSDLIWLDDATPVSIQNNIFEVSPFPYGTSLTTRVARFTLME